MDPKRKRKLLEQEGHEQEHVYEAFARHSIAAFDLKKNEIGFDSTVTTNGGPVSRHAPVKEPFQREPCSLPHTICLFRPAAKMSLAMQTMVP